MANRDQPEGFRPYGQVKMAIEYIAGAAVFPGDAVQAQTDGRVDPAAAGAQDILGISLSHASAAGETVLVSVDPSQMYIAQVNDDGFVLADAGDTYDILATAGNTTFKQSRMEIDGTSEGASQQMVVHALYGDVENAVGANSQVLCSINRHQIWGEDDSAGLQ